jgi:tetrahydromethanopterin S-methyltransferase subunit A
VLLPPVFLRKSLAANLGRKRRVVVDVPVLPEVEEEEEEEEEDSSSEPVVALFAAWRSRISSAIMFEEALGG